MVQTQSELVRALDLHRQLSKYQDELYISTLQRVKEQASAILTPDLGAKIVTNCTNDLSGRIVRMYFPFRLTAAQMLHRFQKFDYINDYDPLKTNQSYDEFTKLQLTFAEDTELEQINQELAQSEQKLRELDEKLAKMDAPDRTIYQPDDLKRAERLQQSMDEADDLALLHLDDGNRRFCKIKGSVVYLTTDHPDYSAAYDITHRATPEQKTTAVVNALEKEASAELIDNGYLDPQGRVFPSVKQQLSVFFSHPKTHKTEAAPHKKLTINSPLGKALSGQILYYAAPPLMYEFKLMVRDKTTDLSTIFERLKNAGANLVGYLKNKLKDIFKNIAPSALSAFIGSFMAILLGTLKSTVQKMFNIIKRVMQTTINAVKIIIKPGVSPAEKADGVFQLVGITISSLVVDTVFDAIKSGAFLPEWMIIPLKILVSVLATNCLMQVFEKADLFSARFGMKMQKIEEMFAKERDRFTAEVEKQQFRTDEEVARLLILAKEKCLEIRQDLQHFDPYNQDLRSTLEKINQLFDMGVDFEAEWQRYLGA